MLEYVNNADTPCPGGLQSSCREQGKASRLSAPAVLPTLKPGLHPELPGRCTDGGRAVSDMLLLLSSRYEEERLKAGRERSVQRGPVRAGGGALSRACPGEQPMALALQGPRSH